MKIGYLDGIKKEDIRYYMKDSSILFNSKGDNYVLSNMYPCHLVYDSINFQSVEQLFHWMLFSNNNEMKQKILKCKGICNGFQVKKVCGENADKIDDDYESKKYKCLSKCLEIKYKQCDEFRKIIDGSWGKELVEEAPWDAEYGAMWHKEYNAYVGKNACGRLMMAVRDKFSQAS